MLNRFRHARATIGLAALYALAMITLGFAHRPVAASSEYRTDVLAYALPDGSLPPICVHDGQGPAHETASAHCEACALSAVPGLVCPSDVASFLPTVRRIALRDDVEAQYAPTVLHGPGSRGPPIV